MILRLLSLVAGALLIDLVLIQPNHPAAATWQALYLFPLELPLILLALVALPGRLRLLRAVLVALLCASVVLKLADFGTFVAFNRGFNVITDRDLIAAGLNLAQGNVGTVSLLLTLAAAAAALGLCALGLWRATGTWARVRPSRPWRIAAAGGALFAAVAVVGEAGGRLGYWHLPVNPPGAAFTARWGVEHLQKSARTRRELRDFARAAATDPYADATGLFDLTDGRDVIVLFVESYGRASFDNPLYAPTHVPTLERGAERLQAAGLEMRSGWLTSPIRGGQSWLAHGTFASGVEAGDQTRYSALMASTRRSLYQLAAASGFHTVAVMPAITMAWPEGKRLGFQEIRAVDDLGYAGLPFNWITMPDQYTLDAMDRLVLEPAEGPVFAQAALISSHAPWTPVAEPVPWDEIGDGTIFNEMATAGPTPEALWRDRDAVRDYYRQTIDYSLEIVLDYALRHADDPPLIVVLGDHQAAGFVAQSDSRDVPIHLIGPPELLAHVESWDWTEGPRPADDLPAWPMTAFRDRFIGAFTSAGTQVTQ